MKIIYNNIIPFKGYIAMNLFGFLFVRKDLKDKLNSIVINHEAIHLEQMKELLYIFFYIIYLLEWLYKVLFKYPFSKKAYKNISFEKEAYTYEEDFGYLRRRKHFSMWK